jgi:hypothetical protein
MTTGIELEHHLVLQVDPHSKCNHQGTNRTQSFEVFVRWKDRRHSLVERLPVEHGMDGDDLQIEDDL